MIPKFGWISSKLVALAEESCDFLKEIGIFDDSLEVVRDPLRALATRFQFPPYRLNVDFSEALLQCRFAVEQDIDVLTVIEVFHQGPLGNHRLNSFAQ